MSSELATTKNQLAEYIDIANKVSAENEAIKRQALVQSEFFTRQIDLLTDQRDRLSAVLKGLTTRYKIIRECFAQCEAEALAEGVSLTAPTKTDAVHEALEVMRAPTKLMANTL